MFDENGRQNNGFGHFLMKMSDSTMILNYFQKNVRRCRNGQPVGRVEMVENDKFVEEMSRE